MTDGDRRIDVRSRRDILLLSEFAFSSFGGSSLKTFCALGCTNGLLGTTVPALNERSSKKLSRSAANFSNALSKSKSRRTPLIMVVWGVLGGLVMADDSVMVELLEFELFRTSVDDDEFGERLAGDAPPPPSPLFEAAESLLVGDDEPLEAPWWLGTSKDEPWPSSSASIATKSWSVKLFRATGFESGDVTCSPYEIESIPAIQK